jgi:hypothetical protein
MPEVTFHALRHTHASQLIDAGVDIVTISKRLGHAKPNITLRTYAHLFRKDDGKAAAAINAAFKPIVGKKLDPIRWQSGGIRGQVSLCVPLGVSSKALKTLLRKGGRVV